MSSLAHTINAVTQALENAALSFGQSHPDAASEARFLVLDCLNLPPDIDDVENEGMDGDTIHLNHAAQQQVAATLQARLGGKPLAYITHKAWLQGLSFYVDERALIPRSYLGELIVEQCLPWVRPEEVRHALDLCTGSGCLAILMAEFFPEAEIDASDVSAAALEVAAINVEHYAKNDRVNLIHSDLFAALPPRRYQLVICNPPYVNAESMAGLPTEFRHEPALALEGGSDGMALIRRILQQAGQALDDEGVLLLEIGNEYEHFVAAFPRLPVIWVETASRDDAVVCIDAVTLRSYFPPKP